MTRTAIVLLVTALALLNPAASRGAVHHVDCTGSGEYLTIQEAVDAAAAGDTVLVAPCVYEEQVTVAGKHLAIQGAGSGVTEITTADSGHTLKFMDFWARSTDPVARSEVSDITIGRSGSYQGSVRVEEGYVVFRDCVLARETDVGSDTHGSAEFHECDADEVIVGGVGDRVIVQDSRVGTLYAGGGYSGIYYYGIAESHSSTIGTLKVTGGTASSDGDTASVVWVEAHIDCYSTLEASGGSFGNVTLEGGGEVTLEDCITESVVVRSEIGGWLNMTGCLVRGDVLAGPYDPWMSYDLFCGPNLTHCTVLGGCHWSFDDYPPVITTLSSIIAGPVSVPDGSSAEFRSCDLVGSVDAPGATFVDNISAAPLFCNAPGDDYTLQDCSPCVGVAHDAGDIGAFGVGCECYVGVNQTTWGRVKGLYR